MMFANALPYCLATSGMEPGDVEPSAGPKRAEISPVPSQEGHLRPQSSSPAAEMTAHGKLGIRQR